MKYMKKYIVVLIFLGMIIVNSLANVLPINNLNTGEISDSFPNLFTPVGFTFSIWGIIYLLLAGYTIFQFLDKKRKELTGKINTYFIISSIANILWVFSWHYKIIWASLILMAVILWSLIKIADIMRTEKFSNKEEILVRWPFSIYFGWITVAAIANVVVFSVSINWSGWGLVEYEWTTFILLLGSLLGLYRMIKDKNIPYGLVFIWALLGIWYKHISVDGFAGQYPMVVFTALLCVGLFLVAQAHVIFKWKGYSR